MVVAGGRGRESGSPVGGMICSNTESLGGGGGGGGGEGRGGGEREEGEVRGKRWRGREGELEREKTTVNLCSTHITK